MDARLSLPGGIFFDKNKGISVLLVSAIYRHEDMKKEPVTAPGSSDELLEARAMKS